MLIRGSRLHLTAVRTMLARGFSARIAQLILTPLGPTVMLWT